ncbi:hypothetical protein AeRB84_008600 [Aphanomyces euteiches]|nr:hypothetical protein AeRB84_008600 [Aphanomyces euteiches]
MPKLFCVLVGEGSPFPVDVAAAETVGDLKKKIKEEKMYQFPADDLKLYLALKGGAWLSDEDPDLEGLSQPVEGNTVLPKYAIPEKWMKPARKLSKFFSGVDYPAFCDDEKIHVLVERPAKYGEWSDLELSTVDPQVQWKIWKSVVRIIVRDSSGTIDSSTALVVDRTPTHLYLLTNLHLNQGYSILHPGKKPNGKRKNESSCDSSPSIRKSKRTKKVPVSYKMFQIAIEQLFPDEEALKEVYNFSLESGICWDCSAAFDFAILEVPTPPNVQLELIRCEMAYRVYPTMRVHVFGFPGNLEDGQFAHHYAIIPAVVTGTNRNQMTLSALSAPGLSGSGIVCTKRGILVGYLGGGFDGSSKNEQYQSYGFTLQGIPQDLPSALPQDEEESKEDT